jgi:hypothetical protein
MNPFEPMPLDAADEAYVRNHFVSLDAACASRGVDPAWARAQVHARALPAPTYVLRDGTPMVPWNYLDPVDVGARYAAAAARNGETALPEEIADVCEGWLEGVYGACLRDVTPEAIWRKETLVARIRAALAAPAPESARWRARLRADVDELDALEKPFARFDRARFGRPVTRDTLVDAPRARFPQVFEVKC